MPRHTGRDDEKENAGAMPEYTGAISDGCVAAERHGEYIYIPRHAGPRTRVIALWLPLL